MNGSKTLINCFIRRLRYRREPKQCVLLSTSSCCTKSKEIKNDSSIDEQGRDEVDPELKAAAKSVASVMAGDQKKTESDLVKQLQKHAKFVIENKNQSPSNQNEISQSSGQLLSEMQIDKRPRKQGAFSGLSEKRVHKVKDNAGLAELYTKVGNSYKLFEGKGLGIFTSKVDAQSANEQESEREQSLFDKIEAEEEMRLFSNTHPRNAFEEMIQWTIEGKLWTFPINNEAGMDEESKVGFHEHVFLNDQISDFPKKGPIRHFMELVTTGLSKNHYLTVQQKHEHLQWFRDYFKQKEALLQERLGADGIIQEAK